MNKISALLAIAALAVPLAACGSSSKSSSSTGSTAAASNSGGSGSSKSSKTTVANSPASAQSGAVKMTMVDDAFQPKAITGKAGSTVKVELKNTGKNEHNFKISSQKQADADVPPGKSATVSVKIPASGSVQFFCEYHKGLGMVGTVKAS